MAPTTKTSSIATLSHFLSSTLRLHPYPKAISSSSTFTNSTASFDWSASDNDDEDITTNKKPQPPITTTTTTTKSNKKDGRPTNLDPTNLQEVFHKMRYDGGLLQYAANMFAEMSRQGLTHEALHLFSQIKDKGILPDVIAHTAVLDAYAAAGGHSKDLLRSYERMLASGVAPNAYTYAVMVKGLAREGKTVEARRLLLEMTKKGMRPSLGMCTAVVEGYVKEGREEDGRKVVDEMRIMGFSPEDETAVRNVLPEKRGKS